MKKMVFMFLLTVWAVMAWMPPAVFPVKIAEFPQLRYPAGFEIEGEKLYLNEGESIAIYSMKDFMLLKRFGRRGEGPREFKLDENTPAVAIHLNKDSLQVNSIKRISFFTKEGEFIKVMKSVEGDYLQPVGENFVGWRRIYLEGIRYDTINLYDANLEKIKLIFKRRNGIQPKLKRINPLTWLVDYCSVYKDKIYINGLDGNIYIYDQKGEQIADFAIDHPRLKMTGKDRKGMLRHYREEDKYWKARWERLKTWFCFPDYFPYVRFFSIEGDRIYIHTFREEKEKHEFLILDLKGKVLKTTFLPIAKETYFLPYPYEIKDGRLYQMMENEDTEAWELHVTTIR